MPPHPTIQQTEKIFLQKLVELIESESLSPTEGQSITQEFLNCVDLNDVAKFKEALLALTLKHVDFKPVYSEFLKLEEQQQVDSVLNKMQNLMGNGDVDGALNVAQSSTTQTL